MTVIFVWLGSAADYGSFGRWLLLVLTVICWALQYGMMAIRDPSQWPAAMAMYVVAYIAYGATLVFYAAVFPRLARYMPHVRKAREEDLREGKIDQKEYDAIESLERNHIRYSWKYPKNQEQLILTDSLSNVSTAHSNIGYLLTLVLNLSVLLPMQNNQFANNLALCLTNSCKRNQSLDVIPLLRSCFKRLGNSGHLVVSIPAEATGPQNTQRIELCNYRLQADLAGHSRD